MVMVVVMVVLVIVVVAIAIGTVVGHVAVADSATMGAFIAALFPIFDA